MRLYHLLVVVLLHFTKGLLKKNDEYVLVPHLENQSCIKHGQEFVHENISVMQCMTLCSNGPSCSHICYVRDIGRCIGCSSAKMLNLELGSRVFLKVSDGRNRPSTARNDRPSIASDRNHIPAKTSVMHDGPSTTSVRHDGPTNHLYSPSALPTSDCLHFKGTDESGLCLKKELTVFNGGHYGVWGEAIFCQRGSYAFGYALKIQARQYILDDTSVNAIGLLCSTDRGIQSSDLLVPGEGEFGEWTVQTTCPKIGYVFKAFQMQVEEDIIFRDASSVNFVRFLCAPLHSSFSVADILELSPGYGFWGSYGNWSKQCDNGQGVCGIKVKLDQAHESDRTGLNDVIFYCC